MIMKAEKSLIFLGKLLEKFVVVIICFRRYNIKIIIMEQYSECSL